MTELRSAAPIPGERSILVGILGVGAFARLYRIDLTWYFLDQVRDVSTAAAIASGTSFPLVGPLVGWTQARLGPLYFYLIAPPFMLSGAPLAGVIFVALAGVLTILLVHRLARDFFGPWVALAASALFAAFPLAVLSSRVLWNPALVPLFTVLFMRALFDVIVGGRSRAIIGAFAWLAVLTQLHLAAASLGVVALIALLGWRPRVRAAHVLAGAGLFLALYAPYLAHEASHRFENTRALLHAVAHGAGGDGERAMLSVARNLLVLGRPVLDGFVVTAPWPPRFLPAFSFLYGVEAVLFVGGLLVCLYRLARGRGPSGSPEAVAARSASLLVLWFLVPLVMLGTRRTALWWYYFDLLYPSQFIVAGIALAAAGAPGRLPALLRRTLAGTGVALVVAIVAAQAWFQVGLQRRIAQRAEIVLDVPRLSVAAAPSSLGTLSFLPYHYRERLLGALLSFGMEPDALPARVHGPVLGLPDENEYLLRHLAGRAAVGSAAGPAAPHYLVTRAADMAPPPSASRSARVGPYLIAEYQPAIDYRDWSWALLSGAPGHRLAEARWQRRQLPAGGVVGGLDGDRVLAWRGGLRVPVHRRPVAMTVSVIAESPLEVFQLLGHGLGPALLGRRSWQSPSLYSTTEADVEIDGAAGAGEIPVAFALAGSGRVMRVDVYERGPR